MSDPSGGDVAHPVHVMVIDDSAVVRQALTMILSKHPRFRVTTASDPIIAQRKMAHDRPDVIVLDLEMPRMNGITFLRRVMSTDPLPVVICSSHAEQGAHAAVRALDEGAVDIITKPRMDVRTFLEGSADVLVAVLDAAAGAKVRRRAAVPEPEQPDVPARHSADAVLPPVKARHHAFTRTVIAVGASTGGTEALKVFLAAMPADAPGIVVVQHMPELFTRAFARRLDLGCRISVKEAEDGDRVLDGTALVAPGDHHLVLHRQAGQYFVEVRDGPPVARHRPSVDVLFRSAAHAAGPNAIGVIMTGMGDDGAAGLLEMRRAGAATIAQNEATCVVFGMPREAILRGAAAEVLPLPALASTVLRLAESRTSRV